MVITVVLSEDNILLWGFQIKFHYDRCEKEERYLKMVDVSPFNKRSEDNILLWGFQIKFHYDRCEKEERYLKMVDVSPFNKRS